MKKFKEFEPFYAAVRKLETMDVNNFATDIIDLYENYINCNCFFNKRVSESLWKELLEILEKFEDNDKDFNLNFSKGFIYLKNKKDANALNYLSISLTFGIHQDIIFYLKASVKSNLNRLEDAFTSVKLRPSSRNFYSLAIIHENIDKIQAIKYYEISGSKSNSFECPFANVGEIYQSLEEFKKATFAYKRCIEINPFHSCYEDLIFCLYKLKDYSEALLYVQLAFKKSSSLRFSSYISLKSTILKEIRTNAYEAYLKKEFKEALSFYEILIEHDRGYYGLSELDGIIYLKILSFNYNLKTILSDENPIFEKYKSLYFTNLQKKTDSIELNFEEENIIKLSIYDKARILHFGKYKGETLGCIIEKDSEYILWIISNITHFIIPMYFFGLNYFNRNSRFFESLEMNFIKHRVRFLIMGIQNKEWEYDYLEVYRNNYSENISLGYEEWLNNEFGDDAGIAFWNLD